VIVVRNPFDSSKAIAMYSGSSGEEILLPVHMFRPSFYTTLVDFSTSSGYIF
jgi:hypothetical protein